MFLAKENSVPVRVEAAVFCFAEVGKYAGDG